MKRTQAIIVQVSNTIKIKWFGNHGNKCRVRPACGYQLQHAREEYLGMIKENGLYNISSHLKKKESTCVKEALHDFSRAGK